ncbi:MAG: hypothetical protein V1489_01690 [Candidatus Liptonbacteria bacterium]
MSPETAVITLDEYNALMLPAPRTSAELFKYQVEFWMERGASPSEFHDLEYDLPEHDPFLLMRDPHRIDLVGLLYGIVVNGLHGKNQVDRSHLRDDVELPGTAYLLRGVRDGRCYAEMRPSDRAAYINTEGNSPFTGIELAVFCAIYTCALDYGPIYAVGSKYRCNRRDGTAFVERKDDGRVIFDVNRSLCQPVANTPWCKDRAAVA